jgi:cell fate (sporulation/competence/biofilm development) regulator YlbF (YheA/YmcA/DUF963 family)
MKSTIFGVFGLLFFTSAICAQISPNPVIETEIRDSSSMRRRSLELERVKRESNNATRQELTKEQIVKFAEIKEDFENIQKLQNEIVKTYTSGKKINFRKIDDVAAEISKKALRLDANLFRSESDKRPKTKSKDEVATKSVRDLIIELDDAIGNFVSSPVFTNNKLVDTKISEKSQIDLQKIIKLSENLSKEAKKLL